MVRLFLDLAISCTQSGHAFEVENEFISMNFRSLIRMGRHFHPHIEILTVSKGICKRGRCLRKDNQCVLHKERS